MGITNNAEEFLLRILNFEIVFEFAEKLQFFLQTLGNGFK